MLNRLATQRAAYPQPLPQPLPAHKAVPEEVDRSMIIILPTCVGVFIGGFELPGILDTNEPSYSRSQERREVNDDQRSQAVGGRSLDVLLTASAFMAVLPFFLFPRFVPALTGCPCAEILYNETRFQ